MITKYKINSETDWKKLKENKTAETLLFKYSPMCGVSFSIERKFHMWLDKISESENLNCVELNVITSRSLSREIAEELNVPHESPQAIWLDKDGAVKWHARHHDITEEELNSNLRK